MSWPVAGRVVAGGESQLPVRLLTVIPTRNEVLHVARAIESVLPLGPVFVVDSESEDATVAIAEGCGATVVVHRWEGYAAQKNWALGNLPLKTEWVLFLDADEIITPQLRDEIERSLDDDTTDGLYIPRRYVFLGRVLRHAWWYPDYQLRLFRLEKGRFEDRLVHEHAVVEGRTGFAKAPLIHENLKGIDAFLERHVHYARLEAEEILKSEGGMQPEWRGRLTGRWPDRRRALKVRLWYRLPFRPAIRFLWLYLVKRGFLDGRQGRVYCQLLAAYEAMIDAELLERQGTGAGPTGPGKQV
ncbi:MAG: glycosyltransferase family 2 protein [Actinomycetota bacterium]|nr:glycosyltransferase family 2 protein [Actinomycetota bacterium]